MCFAVPCEEYEVNPVLSRAMDRIFILHADHEQNASTSTVAWQARRVPTRSPASQPASPACGARLMAAPTRRRSTCSRNRQRRPHPRIHRPGQGQERSVPPDGLWPPRLQELRSARQDHAEDHARGAGRTRHQGRSASGSGNGTRADRADGRATSSRRSSIRTSTSTPASRCGRSASRPPCSRCCSRLRAPSAGSPSGRR
jgi:hypothetical protein